MKQSLSIGPSWFIHERRAYSNWKTAVIRELLQNSTSNNLNSTRIDLSFEDNNDNTKITCADNGKGMSRDILTNVFLVLGETSKGVGEIGGLGIARNLICFSAEKYTIESHDYIVKGSGANYEIVKQHRNHHGVMQGCKFELYFEKSDWTKHAKYVLDRSQVNQSIYINGERYRNNLHRGKFVREFSFGSVWVNKSGNPQLIVRSGGMYMFDYAILAKAQVIIEIDPDKAKQCLTSNRDGLKYEYKKEVDEFLAELGADTQSCLKDRSKRFIKYINKAKGFLSRVKEKVNSLTKEVSVGDILPANQVIKQIINSTIVSPTLPNRNVSNFGGRPEQINNNPICPILESMVIYADTNNENIKKVIKFYDPTQNDGKIGSDRHKFLRQWKNICEIVAGELSNMYNQEYMWAIGVCFDDEAVAMHMKTEGISYIMINPVTNEGKMKYSLNSKSDITKLTISAIHEFVHAAGNQLHNQDFVICYDGLLERVMPRLKDIFHAAADAKN